LKPLAMIFRHFMALGRHGDLPLHQIIVRRTLLYSPPIYWCGYLSEKNNLLSPSGRHHLQSKNNANFIFCQPGWLTSDVQMLRIIIIHRQDAQCSGCFAYFQTKRLSSSSPAVRKFLFRCAKFYTTESLKRFAPCG
jgi:hypothetical protein